MRPWQLLASDSRFGRVQVAPQHVRLERDGEGNYHVTALATPPRAWLNGRQLEPQRASRVAPGDELEVGERGDLATAFRVKMVHASVWRQLGAGGNSASGAHMAEDEGAYAGKNGASAASAKEPILV